MQHYSDCPLNINKAKNLIENILSIPGGWPTFHNLIWHVAKACVGRQSYPAGQFEWQQQSCVSLVHQQQPWHKHHRPGGYGDAGAYLGPTNHGPSSENDKMCSWTSISWPSAQHCGKIWNCLGWLLELGKANYHLSHVFQLVPIWCTKLLSYNILSLSLGFRLSSWS